MAGTLIGNLFINLTARTKNFQKGMARARRTLAAQAARMKRLGKSMTRFGKTLSLRVTLPVALFGAAAVKASGDFESAMKVVEAKSKASGKELTALRERALEMGRTTKFTALQAAQAMIVLTQAGIGAKNAFDVLPTVLNFATAAGRETAESATTLLDTINQFGLEMSDATHITDVFVEAANSAQQDVGDLSESMKFAGLVAKDFGLSFEETVAAVTIMAKAGIRGTMAGRTLRQSILKLVNPSDKAKKIMKQLGVNVFNAGGKFRGFTTILGELAEKGIRPAQVMQIFQARGAAILKVLRAGGPAMRSFTKGLKEVGNAAEKEAKKRLEGFNGALLKLRAAFMNLQIAIGDSGLLEFMTKLVERLKDFVLNLADLNPKVLKWGVILAAAAAVLGPLLIVVGGMVTMFGFFLSALASIFVILGPLVLIMGKLLLVTGLLTAALILGGVAAFMLGKQMFLLGKNIGTALKSGMDKAIKQAKEFKKTLVSAFVVAKGNVIKTFVDMATGVGLTMFNMMEDVRKDLIGRWDILVKKLKEKTGLVESIFRGMAGAIVGNSIVPDMTTGILASFSTLAKGMVERTKQGAFGVTNTFTAMAQKAAKSAGNFKKTVQDTFKTLFRKRGKVSFPGGTPEDKMLADLQSMYKEDAAKRDKKRINKTLLVLRNAGLEVGKALTSSLGNALDDFVEKGKFSMSSFRDFAKSALQDVAKSFLRQAILGPRGGGAGGLLGAIGGLFGFKRGGSFTVAGAGGADSQLVAFKATPGEEVSVRRPGQMAPAGGVTVIQNFALGVSQTVRAEMAALRPQMAAGFAADLADKRMRGGNFSRAITGGS
jgi:TP901 family phage tail tape measure protein